MKHIFPAMVTIALAVTWTFGQATTTPSRQCTLKVMRAPAIRGVKLGMKVDEVLTIFPGSRENEFVRNAISENEFFPKFGVINFGVSPSQFAGNERFTGINFFYFTFLDGRIVRYAVDYGPPPWPRVDDFVNKIASAFQLPPADYWAIDNQARRNLICDGFQVQAMTRDSRGSVVVMTNDDPYKIVRDRRAAAEEKQRQEFKP